MHGGVAARGFLSAQPTQTRAVGGMSRRGRHLEGARRASAIWKRPDLNRQVATICALGDRAGSLCAFDR